MKRADVKKLAAEQSRPTLGIPRSRQPGVALGHQSLGRFLHFSAILAAAGSSVWPTPGYVIGDLEHLSSLPAIVVPESRLQLLRSRTVAQHDPGIRGVLAPTEPLSAGGFRTCRSGRVCSINGTIC